MATLSEDEIRDHLGDLEGWSLADGGIVREFRFPTFRDAVAFVVRLSFEAEAANHHPDLDIRYNRVRVVLSTHSEGGVTALDLDLAGAAQALAGGAG